MLRVRMSWEEVEGGVFLEETQGLGLIPHPTVTLPTWLRALYPHKMFHPRAPNPPLEPSGGDPHPRLCLVQNKRKFFPFSVSVLGAQHCSGALSWEFPHPCSIPDVPIDFPGGSSESKPQQGRAVPALSDPDPSVWITQIPPPCSSSFPG